MDEPVRIGSAVILAVLVVGILVDHVEHVGDYLADVGLIAALFCAISLDEVEISVPAAVYSLIMFVFAALWGSWVSRRVTAREGVSVV